MAQCMKSEELFDLLLKLLRKTSPHKSERQTIGQYLPEGGEWDKEDNYILKVGESETLFCCHLDTVGKDPVKTKPVLLKNCGWIYTSSQLSCLGGDDRCGILCLTALIRAGTPGTYIFHSGEERGCIGAGYISEHFDLTKFKRAVEFDRRGETSIITRMGGSCTCSDTFANALATQLGMGYKPDPTGLYTDVGKYSDRIPECTNVSVGYQNEHGGREIINAAWLINQLIPAIYEVKWEELPVERDPKKEVQYSYHGANSTFCSRHNGRYWGEDDDRFNTWDRASNYNSGVSGNSAANVGVHKHNDFNSSKILPLSDLSHLACDFCFSGGEMKKRLIDGNSYWVCDICEAYMSDNELEITKMWDEEKKARALLDAVPEEEEITMPGIGQSIPSSVSLKNSDGEEIVLTKEDVVDDYMSGFTRE